MAQEQINIDGIDVNDQVTWFLREFKFTPAKKKLNWAESPLSDGGSLVGDEDHYSNAEMEFTVMAMQQTDIDTGLANLHALTAKLQAARSIRGGLPLTWTPAGSSASRTLYVLDAEHDELLATRPEGWFDQAPSVRCHLYLRPFLYGAEQQVALGQSDPMLADSITNGLWRFDAGGVANTSIDGNGRMVFSSTGGKRLYRPSSSIDQTPYLRFRTGTALTGNVGVMVKRISSSTYLTVRFDPAAGVIAIRKTPAGDDLAVSTAFTPAVSTFYWLVGSVEGNEVSGAIYATGQNPLTNPGATPLTTISHTLVSPDDATYGEDVRGSPGLTIDSTPTSWQIDNFAVREATDVRSSEPMFGIELHDVQGEVPAEGRLVITESSTPAVSRSHFEWGMESRTYSTDGAWPYVIDSDVMVTSGFAGIQVSLVPTGAYDPHLAGNLAIYATNISETVPLTVAGTGDQLHVGVFKVKARVWGAEGLKCRLAWRVGDGQFVRNNFSRTLLGLNWEEIDLGTIVVPEAAIGLQTWEGRIEAFGSPVGSTGFMYLDFLEVIPAERYGVARAPLQPIQPTTYTAFDNFNQTATGINNANLPQAPTDGKWHEVGPTGAFAVDLTNHDLRRTQLSDASVGGYPAIHCGRYVIAGTTNFSTIQVQMDSTGPSVGGAGGVPPNDTLSMSLFARYLDTMNWLMVSRRSYIGTGANETPRVRIRVLKRTSGGGTPLGTPVQLAFGIEPGNLVSNRTTVLSVDSVGVWQVYSFAAGTNQPAEPFLSGQDSDLATSGTLQTGRFGIYDAQTSATPNPSVRIYDNFVAFAPTQDVVLHPARKLEIRADRTERESLVGNDRWGRPPMYRGARFFVPQRGDSKRVSRIALKARRTDVDGGLPDPSISDAITAQVYVTPRYLLPSP